MVIEVVDWLNEDENVDKDMNDDGNNCSTDKIWTY